MVYLCNKLVCKQYSDPFHKRNVLLFFCRNRLFRNCSTDKLTSRIPIKMRGRTHSGKQNSDLLGRWCRAMMNGSRTMMDTSWFVVLCCCRRRRCHNTEWIGQGWAEEPRIPLERVSYFGWKITLFHVKVALADVSNTNLFHLKGFPILAEKSRYFMWRWLWKMSRIQNYYVGANYIQSYTVPTLFPVHELTDTGNP